MQLGTFQIENPIVLAPMAGVTDWAYRCIAASLGADITVTEMVSSRALVYHDKKSLSLLRKTDAGICGAQIFGNDPSVMAEGAALALEHSGADFIDINMGCPMPKIAGNGDGSALMRAPEKAARIVEAVKKAVPVPVTVKMRKGWDKGSVNAVELAVMLEQAGASAIAVHGRTKTMLYSGVADWDIIHDVKAAVHIPVIANGDIFSPEDAVRCMARTKADGLMLGQHVYIEMDEGQESQKTGIWLSEVYIVDADTDSPYVWAADKKGKLEKRSVILGQHDEELGEYEIADGLSKDDCIAYPSDILEEGMSTTTNIEDAMDTGNIDMQPLDDSSFSEDPLPDTADTEGVSEYEMSDDGTVVDDPEAVDDSIVDDSSSDESMDMTDGSSDSGEILDDNLMPIEEDTEEAQ